MNDERVRVPTVESTVDSKLLAGSGVCAAFLAALQICLEDSCEMHRRSVTLHTAGNSSVLSFPRQRDTCTRKDVNLLLENPRWSQLQVSALLQWANLGREKSLIQMALVTAGVPPALSTAGQAAASLHPLEPFSGLVSSWDLEPL